MTKFLCAIGMATIVVVVIEGFFLLAVALKDLLHELKWKYTYKHRFDKPPTAKCYCIDCIYHGRIDDNNLCQLHDRHFPNDWFCKDAKPKSAK